MDIFYLVGEPITKPQIDREDFFFPLGQETICQEVLEETSNPAEIQERLRQEYLAIVYTLKQMGVEIRLVFAHEDLIDRKLLGVCIQGLGCRLMGFGPNFFPPSVAYPRDFCTVLPHILLVNESVRLLAPEKDDWKLLSSPYGEGGRALVQGNTMVACERVIVKEGQSSSDPGLKTLRQLGIKIGMFPSLLNGRFSLEKWQIVSYFSNDHVDRGACFLRGENGRLSLVVSPGLMTAKWLSNPKPGRLPWTVRSPAESKALLQERLSPLGIEVCWPSQMRVPYSLNLEQFPDGRVLMTGGDPDVRELVEDIVGKGNVFETPEPIRFFPVWMYAGIRCLVSEAPLPIVKKASGEKQAF